MCVSAELREVSDVLNFFIKSQAKRLRVVQFHGTGPDFRNPCRHPAPQPQSQPWLPLPALFLLEQPHLPHHWAGLGWAQGHCFEFCLPSPVRQRAKGCADTTCLSPAGLGWIRACHRSLQGLQSCPVKRIFVNSHFKSHSISIMLSPWDFFSVPANLPGFLTYK